MTKRRSFVAGLALSIAAAGAAASPAPAPKPVAVVPFDLVNRHVFVKVTVDSRELSFVLDSGAPVAIIDTARAKDLGLALGREFAAHGAGGNAAAAAVEGATYRVPGVPGFAGDVAIAMPLQPMAPGLGRDFDGVLGASFIREFVVELDWQARVLRLHDSASFDYRGTGAIVPIRLNHSGHPVFRGSVTPAGGAPIPGDFVFDIGSNAAVELRRPFVEEHHLPGPAVATIRSFAAGAGGRLKGVMGRVSSFTIGGFTIEKPVAVFSQDTSGVNAMADVAGSIGQRIAGKFTIFFDYARERLILEPNPEFREGVDRAFSGLSLQAFGPDYRTFRVVDVIPGGAADRAGVREGDVIAAIDGRKAADWTLTAILDLLERAAPHRLALRRADRDLEVVLTPGGLV